jgi:hypothetical protein
MTDKPHVETMAEIWQRRVKPASYCRPSRLVRRDDLFSEGSSYRMSEPEKRAPPR